MTGFPQAAGNIAGCLRVILYQQDTQDNNFIYFEGSIQKF